MNKTQLQFLLFLICFQLAACKKDKDSKPSPPPDPIAAYDFNGNAKNSISSLHHGTKVGAVINSLDSFATPNSAYFLSPSAYIEIPDSDVLDFAANRFTFSAWIRPVVTKGSYIIHKGEAIGNGGPYALEIHPGFTKAYVRTTTNETFSIKGHTPIKKNVWQHLAATFNGEQLTIYYNGESEGTIAVDRPMQITPSPVTIGAYKAVLPAATFEGTIDQVRIYDQALTAGQIKHLYNNYK
jgi:hypothetical protein